MILEFFDDATIPEIQFTAVDEQIKTPQECLPTNERFYKFAMAMQLLLSECSGAEQFPISAETLRFLMNTLSQALLASTKDIINDVDCMTKMSPELKASSQMFSPVEDPAREFRSSFSAGIRDGDLESLLCGIAQTLADNGHYEEFGDNAYVGGLKLGALGKSQIIKAHP